MKAITLHGIELNVCTEQEVAKFAPGHQAYHLLGTPTEMVLFPAPTVRELVIAAGIDWNKVDGAVPGNAKGMYPPDEYVWHYTPSGPMEGEPLSLNWCALRVGRDLLRKLIEE